ncbi:hypothetical protein AN958_12514 [Leucoagaricus sp. SymC.cos]|nr:hypothetical protein AN958_12514 [Leucoagaricus sp. SymC.cos]
MSSPQIRSSSFNPFAPDMQTPPPTASEFPHSLNGASLDAGMMPHHNSIPSSQELFTQRQKDSLYPPCNKPGSWMHDLIFGFIHTCDCIICTAYIQHTDMAIKNREPSMAQALQARKNDQDGFFMDGFTLGTHQQHRDAQTRQEARLSLLLDNFKRCVAENDSLRKELEEVKQRFTDLELNSKQLRSSLVGRNSLTSNAGAPSRISPSRTGSTVSLSSPSSSSIGSFLDFSMQSVACASSGPLSSKTDPFELDAQLEVNTSKHQQTDILLQHPDTTTYASIASTRAPQSTTNQVSLPKAASHHLPTSSRSLSDPTPASRHPRNVSATKPPRTISELKELIERAHEPTSDGAKALITIKRFCLKAHNTPREEKTPLQKYALINWRNPESRSSTQSQSPTSAKPNPRIEDSADVWYEYLCCYSHSWPRGVRKDAQGKPFMPDLEANRSIKRMEPKEAGSSKSDFVAQVVDMFSVPGTYEQLLQLYNFSVTPEVTYETFAGPVTLEAVARHFSKCGITPAEAANKFEPFAKSYKEF